MRGKKAKQIRRYMRDHLENTLFQIRNIVGSKTKTMMPVSIYRNCKRFYKQQLFKIS